MQILVTSDSVRAVALPILQRAPQASQVGRPQPGFMASTLRRKKIGVVKVIAMMTRWGRT